MDKSRPDFRAVVYAATEPSFVNFRPGSGCCSPQQKSRPGDAGQIRAPAKNKPEKVFYIGPQRHLFDHHL